MNERVGRLALLDDERRPRVLPITFALAGADVWSAIDRKPKRSPEPARLRYLRSNPAAALCLDVYDEDWSKLAWVQLLGEIAILDLTASGRPPAERAAVAAASAALAAKYPAYAADPPPGPLLRMVVGRTLCWRASE